MKSDRNNRIKWIQNKTKMNIKHSKIKYNIFNMYFILFYCIGTLLKSIKNKTKSTIITLLKMRRNRRKYVWNNCVKNFLNSLLRFDLLGNRDKFSNFNLENYIGIHLFTYINNRGIFSELF